MTLRIVATSCSGVGPCPGGTGECDITVLAVLALAALALVVADNLRCVSVCGQRPHRKVLRAVRTQTRYAATSGRDRVVRNNYAHN